MLAHGKYLQSKSHMGRSLKQPEHARSVSPVYAMLYLAALRWSVVGGGKGVKRGAMSSGEFECRCKQGANEL